MKKHLEEIQRQNLQNLHALVKGIKLYSSSQSAEAVSTLLPPRIVLHTIGSSRLIAYGGNNKHPTLVVPSLINKYSILDLNEQSSFMNSLRKAGLSPYVIDWGIPGQDEMEYGLEAYVERLLSFAEYVHKYTRNRINITGYCMGGHFAVAAVKIAPHLFNKLITIATPWSFEHKDFAPLKNRKLLNFLDTFNKTIPAEFIQRLFYYKNAFQVNNKYKNLADNSEAINSFKEIENWANDGIPIVKKAFYECIDKFVIEQELADEKWHVLGQNIAPSSITLDALCVVAKNDRISPIEDCIGLYKSLKAAKLEVIESGHISMILNKKLKLAHKIKRFIF